MGEKALHRSPSVFFGKSLIYKWDLIKNIKDEDSCDDLVSHPDFITIAIDTHENIGEICVRSSSGDINIPIILLGIFGHMNTPILVGNGTRKNR